MKILEKININNSINIDLKKELDSINISTKESDIEEALENINIILLNSCIKIGSTIVEPFWVESYCFKDKYFKDFSCHQDNAQTKFKKLYFHPKGQAGKNFKHHPFRGVDLTLSKGQYWLAFLLKFNKVGKKYYKECASSWAIADDLGLGTDKGFKTLINNNGSVDAEIRQNASHSDYCMFKTLRKGLGFKAHGKPNKNFMLKTICSFKLNVDFEKNTKKAKKFNDLFITQSKLNLSNEKEIKEFINDIYEKFTSFFDITK